jgi:hypothetical protein
MPGLTACFSYRFYGSTINAKRLTIDPSNEAFRESPKRLPIFAGRYMKARSEQSSTGFTSSTAHEASESREDSLPANSTEDHSPNRQYEPKAEDSPYCH